MKQNRVTDFEFSREKYMELIQMGNYYIESLGKIAEETGHPRAYEVLSALIKNVADMTDKLSTLHKTLGEIEEKEKMGSVIDGSLEYGSSSQDDVMRITTATLQKHLLLEKQH